MGMARLSSQVLGLRLGQMRLRPNLRLHPLNGGLGRWGFRGGLVRQTWPGLRRRYPSVSSLLSLDGTQERGPGAHSSRA